MRRDMPKRSQHLRRATVLTQAVIFGSMVGLGVMALSIDTGLIYTSKQELRNAADAAALAAASQLGSTESAQALAAAEAAALAGANSVAGTNASLDTETDVVFGHAVMNESGDGFEFQANTTPVDAVQVTVRRDVSSIDGPVPLLFGQALGMMGAELEASATAMLVPRDIALVIDLSGSMNDDSELRHYTTFPSETSGTQAGVQINLKEVWEALEGTPPTWGQMTSWGDDIVLGSYAPSGDSGLWYIPRYSTCAESAVSAQLAARGYSSAEVNGLMGSSYDNYSTSYDNRTLVILGLADWKSGMSGGKYGSGSGTGNGNNYVSDSELTNKSGFPYPSGTSFSQWDDYVDYVSDDDSYMYDTDSNFRYRYGLKTFVNYLLEKRDSNSETPELAGAPEEPLHSVKDSVQAMMDVIVDLQTQDRVSLETFAQYGYHAHNLTELDDGESLADSLQVIPDTLNVHQAGHFTSVTNIGGGIQKGIEELTSVRARESSAKIVILLTDGKPNVNSSNSYVGNNHADAISWSQDSADDARELGMTVYAIGVGQDVNEPMLRLVADHEVDEYGNPVYDETGKVKTDNYFFADNTPDPDNNGLPMYVTQLEEIFQTLGGRRPVRLIN